MAEILLADDNLDVLKAAATCLRNAGHHVTSTNNGADALCLVRRSPKDILILDLDMPGLSGHDVLVELGENCPPVLIISGLEIPTTDSIRHQVRRVLLKPFNCTKLLETVDNVLAQSSGEMKKQQCP